jgi:hypothetical protein
VDKLAVTGPPGSTISLSLSCVRGFSTLDVARLTFSLMILHPVRVDKGVEREPGQTLLAQHSCRLPPSSPLGPLQLVDVCRMFMSSCFPSNFALVPCVCVPPVCGECVRWWWKCSRPPLK